MVLVILATILWRRRFRGGIDHDEQPEPAAFARPEPFVYATIHSQGTIVQSTAADAHGWTSEKRGMYAHHSSTVPSTSPSAAGSSQGPGSSHEPSSSTTIISPSEVRDLRNEMQNLRRAMQDIGVERVEPPPTYVG